MRQIVTGDTLETTLLIIKPDGFPNSRRILQKLIKKGFQILMRKKFQLSPEQAADFFKEYEKFKCYMLVILNLSNGPIEVVILSKENAIEELLKVLGPDRPSEARQLYPNSLRALYGDIEDDYLNVAHGSRDEQHAKKEIQFFFPNFIIEPTLRKRANELWCNRELVETLIEGLYQVTKASPQDPPTWLANWLRDNDPRRPVINAKKSKPCQAQPPPTPRTEINLSNAASWAATSSSSEEPRQPPPKPTEPIKSDFEKYFCCCEVDIEPDEIVFCPACEKIIKYAVKPGIFSGARKGSDDENDCPCFDPVISNIVPCSCLAGNIPLPDGESKISSTTVTSESTFSNKSSSGSGVPCREDCGCLDTGRDTKECEAIMDSVPPYDPEYSIYKTPFYQPGLYADSLGPTPTDTKTPTPTPTKTPTPPLAKDSTLSTVDETPDPDGITPVSETPITPSETPIITPPPGDEPQGDAEETGSPPQTDSPNKTPTPPQSEPATPTRTPTPQEPDTENANQEAAEAE